MHFKQSKPITVKMLGAVLLFLACISIYDGTPSLFQIVSMCIMGVLLLVYSISYEINADFHNKRHFQLFGITIFKSKLEVLAPEYIAVFSAYFKQSTDWGPVAAMGKSVSAGHFVIRLFNGNSYFTVFKTSSLQLARTKAKKLGELLNVPIKLPE